MNRMQNDGDSDQNFESDIFDAVFDVENLRVIYVPECEEGISTVRQKNLDATRSHLDTTMMM